MLETSFYRISQQFCNNLLQFCNKLKEFLRISFVYTSHIKQNRVISLNNSFKFKEFYPFLQQFVANLKHFLTILKEMLLFLRNFLCLLSKDASFLRKFLCISALNTQFNRISQQFCNNLRKLCVN